ncbi:MAG: hypothetical protein IJL52_08180 [Clostridia bacterium]|nr:hypothetical protein [Clostridia bacterium]
MKNLTIRQAAKEKKVPLWRVADHLKISEPTLTRKLRHELSKEETTNFLLIIDELAEKGA